VTPPEENPFRELKVSAREEGGVTVLSFAVKAQPRSSRERIESVVDGALKVALTAPPVEGEANAALVALVARALGVSKRDVSLARGATGRNKVLEVAGLTPDELVRRLGGR
jgi:uncharacterized protein (TIGR00251 family)